jgi:uncharacterized protein (TIGR03435 family)
MKAVFVFLAVCALYAQSFDEATIKPAAPDGAFSVGMSGGPGTSEPGHFVVRNMPLRTIIMRAYDVPVFRFDGPAWLGTERFNIEAKVPAGATKEQFQAMLRNLLAERFRVTVHEEERSAPAFALVIDKGGLRMKESGRMAPADGDASPPIGKDGIPVVPAGQKGMWLNFAGGRFVVQGHQEGTSDLAEVLGHQLDQSVTDETGLHARYDFRLEFAPPDVQADNTDQSIFSAVKGLGLRLEPRKVPAKMIVVDHVERTPTAN